VELCIDREVRMVREFEHGELNALLLERAVAADERVADVVASVADALDAAFDTHARGGGWRHY
jgi:hypothetical protein